CFRRLLLGRVGQLVGFVPQALELVACPREIALLNRVRGGLTRRDAAQRLRQLIQRELLALLLLNPVRQVGIGLRLDGGPGVDRRGVLGFRRYRPLNDIGRDGIRWQAALRGSRHVWRRNTRQQQRSRRQRHNQRGQGRLASQST